MKSVVRVRGMLLLTATVLLASYSAPALAWCREYTTWREHYNGCGSAPSIVGEDGQDCQGHFNSWGTTGHWYVEYFMNCEPLGLGCYDGDVYDVQYYEKCGSLYVQRTQNDFETGNCQCSSSSTELRPIEPRSDDGVCDPIDSIPIPRKLQR